jgi:hypothetical protein
VEAYYAQTGRTGRYKLKWQQAIYIILKDSDEGMSTKEICIAMRKLSKELDASANAVGQALGKCKWVEKASDWQRDAAGTMMPATWRLKKDPPES